MEKGIRKDYRVAIDTVPLPEKPAERIEVILSSVTPVIGQIVSDAMTLAIGTWPTPERPEEQLMQAREGLHQEWVGLQILGRALTEQELQRSDALGGAVKLIDEALGVLGVEV